MSDMTETATSNNNPSVDAATFDMVRELVKGPSIHGEARMSYSETTRRIFTALQLQGWQVVPPDCVVRPREVTTEMVKAGIDADDKRTGSEACKHIYLAMTKAGERK